MAVKKSRLGKGLDALFADAAVALFNEEQDHQRGNGVNRGVELVVQLIRMGHDHPADNRADRDSGIVRHAVERERFKLAVFVGGVDDHGVAADRIEIVERALFTEKDQ